MTTDHIRRTADLLVAARRSGQPLDAIPADLMPADPATAYAVQDLVTASLGAIGGWKTAPTTGEGVPYSWAPIPAAGIQADGADITGADFPRAGLELEIGLLLGSDLPPRAEPYALNEVTDAIAGIRVCLEVIASRYATPGARNPLEKIADAQSAAGLVVGSGTDDWRNTDLAATELSLEHAGQRHTATGGAVIAQLLEATVRLANGTQRLGGLRAGQVIITGARIGPVPAATGDIVGTIHPVGTVRAAFI